MTWAKLDDRFHSHPKIRAAWMRCPASIGLHAMAISYCADHETDGVVPEWFAVGALPRQREMREAVAALIAAGLWREHAEGWEIHDFLDYHLSREAARRRREADAQRKRRERGSD